MNCRICDEKIITQDIEVKEMMYGFRDKFDYVHCNSCDCLQIKDFPLNLEKYYGDNYYSYKPNFQNRSIFRRMLIRLRNKYAIFNEGLIGRFLYQKFPNSTLRVFSELRVSRDTKILDVGCGHGGILQNLREVGCWNLLGIDPFNKETIQYKNGLMIEKKFIYEVEGKWDVIMMNHSFEHVSDPLETLQKINNLLKDNGVGIIRIPTISSFAWEHYKDSWVQLDAPRHFFLHSNKSMKLLVEKAGFKIFKIQDDSTYYQFYGSEQLKNDIAVHDENSYAINPQKSIFTNQQIKEYKLKAKELNKEGRGDQSIYFLRKK